MTRSLNAGGNPAATARGAEEHHRAHHSTSTRCTTDHSPPGPTQVQIGPAQARCRPLQEEPAPQPPAAERAKPTPHRYARHTRIHASPLAPQAIDEDPDPDLERRPSLNVAALRCAVEARRPQRPPDPGPPPRPPNAGDTASAPQQKRPAVGATSVQGTPPTAPLSSGGPPPPRQEPAAAAARGLGRGGAAEVRWFAPGVAWGATREGRGGGFGSLVLGVVTF